MLVLLSSCSGKKKQLAEAIKERDSLPLMDTRGVTTLISDSGVTRYRIKTDEWLIYDKKRPSYWAFEKGVYLEKFDSLLHVDASIKADTAYYYDKQKLWKLSGHVAIKNQKGDKFNTEVLYWNEATQKRKPKRKAKKNRGEIERKRSVVKAQIFTYWSNE